MRIAIDIGFGFVKVQTETGIRKMFPSLVKNRVETGLKGIVGGKQDKYSVTYWDVDDSKPEEKLNIRKVYVGDAAMTNGGDRNWEDKDKLNVDDIKILITTAIALVNPNNEPIDVCVGLPMSFFTSMKDELMALLKKINARLLIGGITGERSIKVKSVFVFPQGAGAYWGAILDTNGEIKDAELAGSTVAVIDVGYRTVDYLVMKKGREGINMIEELSGSLEDDGMNKAYQDIQTALIESGRGTVDVLEIEKALLWFGAELELLGDTITLMDYEAKAYKDRAESIASKLKRKWGKQEETMKAILISGGGGNALLENFKDKFRQAKPIHDIVFEQEVEEGELSSYDNCAGYLGIQARRMKKANN
jgi:plasmid segregation protein ParM